MFISDFIKYIQTPEYLGVVSAISKADKTITSPSAISSQVASGAKVRIQGASPDVDLIYTVDTVTTVDTNTVIKVKEEITSDITITSAMNVKLFKGVDITQTEIGLSFNNKNVSMDDAQEELTPTAVVRDNIVKLAYNKADNTVNCKTYGYLLTPYEEQTELEYKGIMDKVGTSKLNNYFKGMYEAITTFFSNLSITDIDSKRATFYVNMQDASIEDAGSFVIINPDEQAKVRVESILYFMNVYETTEVNKIKYMNYGESITVENPEGNEEIITCARACTFDFKESV